MKTKPDLWIPPVETRILKGLASVRWSLKLRMSSGNGAENPGVCLDVQSQGFQVQEQRACDEYEPRHDGGEECDPGLGRRGLLSWELVSLRPSSYPTRSHGQDDRNRFDPPTLPPGWDQRP